VGGRMHAPTSVELIAPDFLNCDSKAPRMHASFHENSCFLHEVKGSSGMTLSAKQ